MRPEQIGLAKNALTSVGIWLGDYDLDIGVNLSETVRLIFTHKSKPIKIIVDDPTNYPCKFEIKRVDPDGAR